MSSPLISIILPTRNRLASISKTIERVQSQTFKHWELIVSDNASDEDGKVDYLKRVAANDSRVRLYFQKENIGIHANWKFCITETRGRYYIPVTDDDWWGEDNFLQELLAQHDGKTASVFPNMTIHQIDTGSVIEGALSSVYGGITDRYQIYERLLQDGRGVIMIGLLDMEVVPKTEIISVIDNDLAIAIETVGMNRIARQYPVRFCGRVSYHHTAYNGNYCRTYQSDQLDQDRGIVSFQLLDDLRKAARQDEGFNQAFLLQWQRCIAYGQEVAGRAQYDGAGEGGPSRRKSELKELRRELKTLQKSASTLRGAIQLWWALRSGRTPRNQKNG